jgi:hypothetical protein
MTVLYIQHSNHFYGFASLVCAALLQGALRCDLAADAIHEKVCALPTITYTNADKEFIENQSKPHRPVPTDIDKHASTNVSAPPYLGRG